MVGPGLTCLKMRLRLRLTLKPAKLAGLPFWQMSRFELAPKIPRNYPTLPNPPGYCEDMQSNNTESNNSPVNQETQAQEDRQEALAKIREDLAQDQENQEKERQAQEAKQWEAAQEALASYMEATGISNESERYEALRGALSNPSLNIPARLFQKALIEWAKKGYQNPRDSRQSSERIREAWVYLWSQTWCGSTGVIWGGSSVDLENFPLLLSKVSGWQQISNWAGTAMPKGPLGSDLGLQETSGGYRRRLYRYSAPAMPPIEGDIPTLGIGTVQELDMTQSDVEDWQSQSGACNEGTVEFLRALDVDMSVNHSWDSFEGCIECAQNDHNFDHDAELGIESIDHIEDFTLALSDLDDLPGEHDQYLDGLWELFEAQGGQWEDPEECLKALEEKTPDLELAKLEDGAIFFPDILGHIESLDLEDWEPEQMMQLALGFRALADRYHTVGMLPPIKGALSYAGSSWEFNGEEFTRRGLTLTLTYDSRWHVNGHSVMDGSVHAESRGRDAAIGHALDNMRGSATMA